LSLCLICTTALHASAFAPFVSPAAQQQDNSQQNAAQGPNQNPDQNNNQDYDQNNGQDNGSYENYSPDQLDNLLAPIALYPDPLLAQVLPAATFVDQIDEAARYVRANGQSGVDDQDWDVSVKAVAHYPAVLDMMADKIDWTTALGQAYVNQSTDVMTSVQRLRRMANDQGNLVTNQQQQVVVQPSYIQIWPAQPQYVYVPVYNPAYVYYQRPSYGSFYVTFGSGLFIGAWLNRDCDWGGRRIYYTGWNGGGWIGRSRGYVHINNTVYVNNRYTNVTINRTVINRRVNYTSINRYNSIHRNVNYNNLNRNNTIRDRRPVNNTRPGGNTRPGNTRPGSRPPNNNNRPNNNTRPANNRPTTPTNRLPANTPNTRPGNRPNNGEIDRNINTGNGRVNDFRGRDNPQTRPTTQPGRPANQPAPARPAPSTRPAPQNTARPQAQPRPNAFNSRETNFNANQASARGQASRTQQPQRQAPQRQAAPQQRQRAGAPPKNSGKPR
jgi:Protein of unknown function (DUF3300)